MDGIHEATEADIHPHPSAKSNPSSQEVYTSRGDIPGVSTGDRILFNPGHTEYLQSLERLSGYAELVSYIDQYSETNRSIMAIPPEKLVEFLTKCPDPHAISEVLTIVKEEWQQAVDPQKQLEYVRWDLDEIEQLKGKRTSQEEMEEAHKRLAESQTSFREALSVYPGQVRAVANLLEDPAFGELITNYKQQFAETRRLDSEGRPTSKIRTEYLNEVFEGIKERMTATAQSLQSVFANEDFTSLGFAKPEIAPAAA